MKSRALFGMLLLGFASVQVHAGETDAGDAAHGKQLYARYCVVCHGAAGAGGLGPSLKGAASRLSPAQGRQQIVEPKATMPRLYPNTLTDVDVRDVVAYVLTL